MIERIEEFEQLLLCIVVLVIVGAVVFGIATANTTAQDVDDDEGWGSD